MKVLILVLSYHKPPYNALYRASRQTWDSEEVDGVETLYYFGAGNPINEQSTITVPVQEGLMNMGRKTLAAFGRAMAWDWDVMARVNSSCYVDKVALKSYCEGLPTKDLFAGSEVDANPRWMWGGGQYLISRDVVQGVLANASKWNHGEMEDMAMSRLIDDMGVPYSQGKSASVNLMADGGYLFLTYPDGSGNTTVRSIAELKGHGHHFIRVKTDTNRHHDIELMQQLWSTR